jgi:integrase
MSVFRTKKSHPYYWYGFQIRRRRFYGSTQCTARKEAEKFEAVEKEKARALLKASALVAGSLQIDHVAERYWNQIGQHHAGAVNTECDLARLVDYFGKAKLLTDITGPDVAKLVAWRRGQRVKNKGKSTRLVSPSTVNRSCTVVLKTLFTFAKREGVRFEHEPQWKTHFLKEPVERVRELQDAESDSIATATRDDYKPLFDFVRATGMRQKECVSLKWSEVNFGTRQVTKLGKGDERVTFPITPTIREILFPLQGHHPEFVFTYVSERTRKGEHHIRGQRYPMTLAGLKSRWRRMRAEAGVTDFRFHDFRHDFGSKLLRETGNMKLVQKAMNHKDMKTTAKYAHVLDEDIASAIESVAKAKKVAVQGPSKSQSPKVMGKSQATKQKAG